MAEVRFEKVSKRFGDVTVVEELDLTILDGEFFTFVGPSGCGKSTILTMTAGLLDPSGGRIFFDGERVDHLSPGERDVAMVFQSYALYPHLSVYDNLAFPLRMKKKGKDDIDRDVRRVAALLDLEGLLERKPRQLSGGQRQRVALGRSIIRKPRVFLMDEPLSNLDARLRMETRGELKRLHRELGITTVYVTHDQAEALGLSSRIAVIKSGAICQCGTPHDVYFKPANLFVATFIGSPAMNVIKGNTISGSPSAVDCNGYVFSPPSGRPPSTAAVLIGIRPDDVAIAEEASPGALDVTVSATEPAGSFNWVEVDWRGTRLLGKARANAHLLAGGRGFATFPMEAMLLFDAVSEERL